MLECVVTNEQFEASDSETLPKITPRRKKGAKRHHVSMRRHKSAAAGRWCATFFF